jgi:hypothetical protein
MLGWTIGSNKTGGIRFKNQKTWPRTNPWLIVHPYLAIRAPPALKEENKLFNRYSHFCCVRKSCFMTVVNSSTESPCLTQIRGDEKMNRMIFTFYGTFTCKIPSLSCDSTMDKSHLLGTSMVILDEGSWLFLSCHSLCLVTSHPGILQQHLVLSHQAFPCSSSHLPHSKLVLQLGCWMKQQAAEDSTLRWQQW